MKQEKVGTEQSIFFDTYALIAIAEGKESYRGYISGLKVTTTLMNLFELYFILLQENLHIEAEKFFEKFLPSCIEIEPSMIKEAARFRLQHKKLGLSYVDALGYIISQEMKIKFLTGDDGFKHMENVLFVK